MNITQLTKHLISIPSYVSANCNERKIGDFIFEYLNKHTTLIVIKQCVTKTRNNIIAYSPSCVQKNKLVVDTLFVNHIDTVEPKKGWNKDQFEGIVENQKIYGLGAYDTKGNVAVLMKLAEKVVKEKIMFLFYCDEEYDFLGMKTFIHKYKDTLAIKNVISTDGSSLQIRNYCRGLIELDIQVFGRTGHSANPKNGVSAITAFINIVKDLIESIQNNFEEIFGKPTLNIAYVRGGLLKEQSKKQIVLGKNGNNLPDYLESTLEFRTNTTVNLLWVKKKLKRLAQKYEVTITISKVRHNLTAWKSDTKKLSYLEKELKKIHPNVFFDAVSTSGYVDIAMLAENFNCTCCTIGALGNNAHGINEYVEIPSLLQLYQILLSVF